MEKNKQCAFDVTINTNGKDNRKQKGAISHQLLSCFSFHPISLMDNTTNIASDGLSLKYYTLVYLKRC
jgi:hypothetical protein